MKSLRPLVTESGSLDNRIHVISPTASDANFDENEEGEEYFDGIEQLQKALLSIGVSDTEGTSLEEILNSQKQGWLRLALFSDDGRNIHVNETTAILSLFLLLPKTVHKNFEHAWGKSKTTLVKRCDTHLSDLEGVRVFYKSR
jgi:hypothetical protein